uniref:Uncharacterized protein n=1 Tax=Lates calcarifer TaxID=8187 RepID=A0A4W6EBG6_LATCA
MAFLMNQMLGDKLRSFTRGGEDNSKAGADGEETPEAKGMFREESEEYQRQLVEGKTQYVHIPRIINNIKMSKVVSVCVSKYVCVCHWRHFVQ